MANNSGLVPPFPDILQTKTKNSSKKIVSRTLNDEQNITIS